MTTLGVTVGTVFYVVAMNSILVSAGSRQMALKGGAGAHAFTLLACWHLSAWHTFDAVTV